VVRAASGVPDPARDATGKAKGDEAKLRTFHAADGWLGWKKGPALLADCPLYGWDGWLPAHTHGWYSTMLEYDGSVYFPYFLVFAAAMPSMGADSSTSAAPKIADRAACSSLIQCKQPTEKVLQTVAGLGYRWVDLSCMSWASHVSVPKLLENFDKEAARVEAALAASGLKVANLTFPDTSPCRRR